MKRKIFTESQTVMIIKEAEAGIPVADLCRKYRFSSSTFDKLKAKYGGMDAPALRRLKELEEENRRLKAMYAELSLEHRVLKDIVEKKPYGLPSDASWQGSPSRPMV
jgi:putative transposase